MLKNTELSVFNLFSILHFISASNSVFLWQKWDDFGVLEFACKKKILPLFSVDLVGFTDNEKNEKTSFQGLIVYNFLLITIRKNCTTIVFNRAVLKICVCMFSFPFLLLIFNEKRNGLYTCFFTFYWRIWIHHRWLRFSHRGDLWQKLVFKQ